MILGKWFKKHHYKRKIIFATHALTTGMFVWMYGVFLYIYFFTSDKSISLFINRLGEADFELVLLSLLVPIVIVGLILNYIFLRRYL